MSIDFNIPSSDPPVLCPSLSFGVPNLTSPVNYSTFPMLPPPTPQPVMVLNSKRRLVQAIRDGLRSVQLGTTVSTST